MSLIAQWKMDDASGQKTAVDSVGSYNGTADNNITSTVGHSNGTAIQFVEANSDKIIVGDNAVFTPESTPMSWAAWVSVTDITDAVFVHKGVFAATAEYKFHLDSSGYLSIWIKDKDEGGYIGRKYGTAFELNVWHYITCTYDGGTANSGIKLYIDGVNVDNTNFSSGSFVKVRAGGDDIWIGAEDTTVDAYSDLSMEDLRIYDTALTQEEIKQIMSTGGYRSDRLNKRSRYN